jgi:hypothetical protein
LVFMTPLIIWRLLSREVVDTMNFIGVGFYCWVTNIDKAGKK